MKNGWINLKRWRAWLPVRAGPKHIEQVPVVTLAIDRAQAERLARDAGLTFAGPARPDDEGGKYDH